MRSPTVSTRERLLAAAYEEFAARGIAGARIARIAELAGVNRERIYGYFGSKEGLFDAVIGDALDKLAESVPLEHGDDLAEYVGRVYDHHRENPELLRLLLWEALYYRNQPLPGTEDRTERYREKVEVVRGALGSSTPAEAATVLLTLIGVAAWPNAVPQLAEVILGAGAEGSTPPEVMRSHLMTFARRALSTPPTTDPAPSRRRGGSAAGRRAAG